MTLRIGTDDVADRPAGKAIEEFARQVKERSRGSVLIEPVWRAAGAANQSDWDQKVARQVVSGDLDLGMVPARAWDTEGVSSLRPLHAPLLVDSNELMDRVASDEVAADMLAGLDDIGVEGLALIPESLRHPFSFADPVLSPKDLEGRAIRAPRSSLSFTVLTAFGARPGDGAAGFADEVTAGTITAAESSFDFAAGLPALSVGTANVTLYPKVQSLVANAAAFKALSGNQRTWLVESAVSTREWAAREMPSDAKAAKHFCDGGGRSVLAPDSEEAAWAAAVRPVYAQLDSDPATKQLLDRIRRIKAATTVSADAVPAPCGSAPTPLPTPSAAAGAAIPEGTYRRLNSRETLMAAGLDESKAQEYAGILTFALKDGVYTESPPAGATFAPCRGSYTSTAATIEVRFETNCQGAITAQWRLRGEALRLSEVRDPLSSASPAFAEAIWGGGRPFTKIG